PITNKMLTSSGLFVEVDYKSRTVPVMIIFGKRTASVSGPRCKRGPLAQMLVEELGCVCQIRVVSCIYVWDTSLPTRISPLFITRA
ncbi:MAG: hypothetical protein JJU28_18100, partial [Cyclobacteriaceae bacterium]|nr:hypothetical protein [Cyclobacteriaceae bacterium]